MTPFWFFLGLAALTYCGLIAWMLWSLFVSRFETAESERRVQASLEYAAAHPLLPAQSEQAQPEPVRIDWQGLRVVPHERPKLQLVRGGPS